jgi:tRNA (cmo5U34)-methyltransferase
MTERDALFRDPSRRGPFEFDDEVAKVLPDMLARSIPGYGALLELIGVLSGRTLPERARVYDLGCSLGAVSLAVLGHTPERNVEIVAVDSSPAMTNRLAELLRSRSDGHQVTVRHADVLDVEIERASLVVLNFTMQFVSPERRDELVLRIARGLSPGGVLVLSEKVKPASAEESVLAELHDEFRKNRGYSELELARKRKALEDVLVPDTTAEHIARMEHAGLRPVEWFRGLGFVSWLATRSI